jgi:hypothetical protein
MAYYTQYAPFAFFLEDSFKLSVEKFLTGLYINLSYTEPSQCI